MLMIERTAHQVSGAASAQGESETRRGPLASHCEFVPTALSNEALDELNWLASEHLALFANLGLLRTEFDQYTDLAGNDLSGRDQAQAPHYQYAVGGRYDFARGFYLRLDLEGRDSAYFSDRHDLESPAYRLLNARLGYTGERWSLAQCASD